MCDAAFCQNSLTTCYFTDITITCADTVEPIEMPFGVWTWVRPWNREFGDSPDPLGERAFLGGGRDTLSAMQPFVKIF